MIDCICVIGIFHSASVACWVFAPLRSIVLVFFVCFCSDGNQLLKLHTTRFLESLHLTFQKKITQPVFSAGQACVSCLKQTTFSLFVWQLQHSQQLATLQYMFFSLKSFNPSMATTPASTNDSAMERPVKVRS